MSRSTTLRARLAEKRALLVPGAADALTARIIEDTGFHAVYVTGAGFANSSLGVPDLGLTTMPEVLQCVSRIADAVDIPVIADADTGYGGALNVIRTVREFERAGASAIQLEDQVFPKKCGHFDSKDVISTQEMVKKIEAALYARRDPETIIIARTDAGEKEGFEGAIERANQYADAGADVIFLEALRTEEEIRRAPSLVHAPLLINMVEGGKTPLMEGDTLDELGYAIVLYANTALRAAMKAIQRAMATLMDEGSTLSFLDDLIPWSERQRLVKIDEYNRLSDRFAVN